MDLNFDIAWELAPPEEGRTSTARFQNGRGVWRIVMCEEDRAEREVRSALAQWLERDNSANASLRSMRRNTIGFHFDLIYTTIEHF